MLRRGFGDGFCSWSIVAEPGPPQAAGSQQQSWGLKSTAWGRYHLVLNAHRDRDPRPQGQAPRSSCSLKKHPGGSQLQGSLGDQGNPGPGGRGRILVEVFEANLAEGPHQGSLSPATDCQGKRASLQETACRGERPWHLQLAPTRRRCSPPFLLPEQGCDPTGMRCSPGRGPRRRAGGGMGHHTLTAGMLQAFISEDEGDAHVPPPGQADRGCSRDPAEDSVV